MNFDASSAVAVDNNIVNTTKFDINSAKDEPQLQEATPGFFSKDKATLDAEGQPTATNPATDVTKFFHNLLNRSYEDLQGEHAYVKSDYFPKPIAGEDVMHYAERVKPAISNTEAANIRQGTMAQFSKPITKGLAVGAVFDPIGTAAMVGGFMAKQQLFDIRKILDKYAPDTPTDIKDGAEVIDNLVTGGILGHGIGVARPAVMAFLNERGLPDATTLSPDVLKGLKNFDPKVGELAGESGVTKRPSPYVTMSQVEWPSPEIDTPTGKMQGETNPILDKLGITPDHYNAAITSDIPVKVPLTNILNLAKDPHWDDLKQIMTFEGEGGVITQEEENAGKRGESTQSGSGQEGIEGQAQASVHIRNNGEAKEISGEEITSESNVPRETVTSKIAKSIEQKAVDAKLTDKFENLAGEEKVNVAEQSKMATDLVNSNIDDARAIVRGDKPLPDRLRGISIITAMEEHLKNNPDGDIAQELGNSPLVSATTRAAQELRLAAEREPDSFTQKYQELKRALIDSKGGDEKVAKTKKAIIKEASASFDKMNLSDKELGKLDDFFKEIEC